MLDSPGPEAFWLEQGRPLMADDEEYLLDIIRRKILAGALPKLNCRMTWFTPGSSAVCAACDRPIESTEVEVECDLSAGGTLRLHRRCYELWVAEWTTAGRGR